MKRFQNNFKTVLLLVLLSALFLGIGYAIGGRAGVQTAFILSLVMNIGSYWFSDKLVLAMHRAKELPKDHKVHQMVEQLASANQMPMPRVYWVPDRAPNAFATGRSPKHSAVAVTQGLLDILEDHEIKAVLAHELGHVQNRDTLISTIAASIASAIMYLAHMMQWASIGASRDGEDRRGINPIVMILTVILAPIATMLVQAAISRSREFEADATGARFSKTPDSLASALQKISNPALIKKFQRDEMLPDMQPAFSHLYIVNHFSTESVMSLFSTHPPVRERVRRLKELR